MAFGSLGPSMFSGGGAAPFGGAASMIGQNGFAGLLPMLLRGAATGGSPGTNAAATLPAAPPAAGAPPAQAPGLLNRAMGLPAGMGLLNKLFAPKIGAPMDISAPGVPQIPPLDPSFPGPNQLTGHW